MNSSRFKQIVLSTAIIVGGFVVVILLSQYLEKNRPQLPDDYSDSDLALQGSRLKGYSFGAEGLIADWYYMRALQYIGEKMLRSNAEFINIEDLSNLNARLLYPYLENATELDPHFIAAYSYGAMVLPAINKDHAIKLAEKGIANNPNEWRLYQYLGYIYWKAGEYETAAHYYDKGSQLPDAAPFMKLMAASMRTEGGSRSTAREIYKQMFADSDDQMIKMTAERWLMRLDWYDERDAIDPVLTAFKDRNGRCANSLAEILPMLKNVRLPEGRDFRMNERFELVDPSGAPYLLNKAECSVELDRAKTIIALD